MAKKVQQSLTNVRPGAIATIDPSSYALISDSGSLDAMTYNLQNEQISEFDLDRIKVPAGGATVFQVPEFDGIANREFVEGIVLHIGIRRSYWVDPNPTGVPPSCYSVDGLRGIGNPGGDCGACPFNQFGSAVNASGKQGRGKRCREMRVILLIRPQDRLPLVVLAPPASIKGIKKWLMRLPVFMFQAVIRLELKQDKNGDGIVYSRLVPSHVGTITLDAAKGLQEYAETIKKAIVGKAPTAAEFKGGGDDDGDTLDSHVVPAGGAEELPEDGE